jgi:copper resistance protein C
MGKPDSDGLATLVTAMHPSRLIGPLILPLLLALALAFPATVAAHAELASTVPAEGAVLDSPPTEVVATFTEALNPNRSVIDLLLSNSVIASSGPNPADPTRLVLSDLDLEPGEYEVRWTAAGNDGHLERGRFSFTVLEPTPTPVVTPTAAPTAGASSPTPAATPVSSPSPVSTPTAAPSPVPGAGDPASAEAIVPIIAMLGLVGLLAVFLVRRRGRPTASP